jgi:hypothetical protein
MNRYVAEAAGQDRCVGNFRSMVEGRLDDDFTGIWNLLSDRTVKKRRGRRPKMDRRPSLKLRAAMAVWQSFQPESIIDGGRLTRGDFSFLSWRTVGLGAKTHCYVRVWRVDDARCAMTVHMALYDERVGTLESTAVARDVTDLAMLDFGVRAASSLIDGEVPPDLPMMESKHSIEGFAKLVEDYSRRIDRIWQSVGGCSVEGLERLAIWALRNREQAGAGRHGLGPACAAFLYGERELAHELLDELRSVWETRLREAPDQHVFDMYERVCVEIERLLEAVKPPTAH